MVEKMSMIYEALLELHAEMVLDEAVRHYQERRLYAQIDQALADKDEPTFRTLVKRLQILQSNGTDRIDCNQ